LTDANSTHVLLTNAWNAARKWVAAKRSAFDWVDAYAPCIKLSHRGCDCPGGLLIEEHPRRLRRF
jgi:hypothetical protein